MQEHVLRDVRVCIELGECAVVELILLVHNKRRLAGVSIKHTARKRRRRHNFPKPRFLPAFLLIVRVSLPPASRLTDAAPWS